MSDFDIELLMYGATEPSAPLVERVIAESVLAAARLFVWHTAFGLFQEINDLLVRKP